VKTSRVFSLARRL